MKIENALIVIKGILKKMHKVYNKGNKVFYHL